MFRNYIKTAWKVFRRKKLFSLISLYGITAPMVFIIILFSVVTHLTQNEKPMSQGDRMVYLDNIRWMYIDENGERTRSMGNWPSYQFIKKNLKPLKSPEMIVSAVSSEASDIYVYRNNQRFDFTIKYTDPEFWQVCDHEFLLGRPFNEQEFEEGQKYAVIDKPTAEFHFADENPIGRMIDVYNESFRVIGVVEEVDVTKHRIAANIYTPLTTNDRFKTKSIFSGGCSALMLLDDRSDFDELNDQIQLIAENYDVSEIDYVNKLEIDVPKTSLSQEIDILIWQMFSYSTGTFGTDHYQLIAILIAFLLFIVLPTINIININLNRISERNSEIGIRKSFGARSGTLVVQFITETVFFTIIGSLLAIIIAWICLFLINESGIVAGAVFSINLKALAYTFVTVLFFGFLSGAYPAWKMSRQSIVHSLNS